MQQPLQQFYVHYQLFIDIYSKDLESLHRANKIIAENKTAAQLDPGDGSTVNPMVWQLSKAGSEKAQVKVFAYLCL
jgi:hypothetical protein